MANSYNSNPIIIDTDMTSGWRANQTLNTANLPSNAQQLSGTVKAQWGIHVEKIQLVSNGTVVAGTVNINDPVDATLLWTQPVATTFTAFTDDNSDGLLDWKDFKATGLTATVTKLLIWYRD